MPIWPSGWMGQGARKQGMQDKQGIQMSRSFWQSKKGIAVLSILLLLFAALSFRFGSAELSFADVCKGLAGAPGGETQSAILR